MIVPVVATERLLPQELVIAPTVTTSPGRILMG